MSSIYEIKQDLLNIFDTIEENSGEITPEQEELLAIKQEELNIKLNNYNKALISWNADIIACKEEEKRIAAVRKKHENRINKLKEVMLDAVLTFGDTGKSGNKVVELPTVRLFTKATPKIEVDDVRIDILIEHIDSYILELYSNGCLNLDCGIDATNFLENINNRVLAEYGADFEPFTMMDLITLKIDITSHLNIIEYFNNASGLVDAFVNNRSNCTIKNNTPKEDWKVAQEVAEKADMDLPTVARKEVSQSIQIK